MNSSNNTTKIKVQPVYKATALGALSEARRLIRNRTKVKRISMQVVTKTVCKCEHGVIPAVCVQALTHDTRVPDFQVVGICRICSPTNKIKTECHL